MYVIVGLGNPDLKYAATRHNVGFEAAVSLKEKAGFSTEKSKFNARICTGRIHGEQCVICRPMTYMNLSGNAVSQVVAFYNVEPSHVIVMYDDVNLPFGHLRIRDKGSAGGHNGMKSVIAALGTDQFPRVRIGVGEKPDGWDLADYVLSKFTKEEIVTIRETIDQAAEAAQSIIENGITETMNRYNTPKSHQRSEDE